jgi:hypothetical protein
VAVLARATQNCTHLRIHYLCHVYPDRCRSFGHCGNRNELHSEKDKSK